jgi:beta-glucanase (GH16 family)
MLGEKKPCPANGEIDIMEWWSRTPETSFATTHFSLAGKHKSDQGKIKLEKLTEGFHVYGLEWTPDRLDYTFDGKISHSFPTAKAVDGTFNPFQQPHYLLINLALGGSSGGKIDDSKLPQQYLIDYVRVYQKK